jgi:hypothetical protein
VHRQRGGRRERGGRPLRISEAVNRSIDKTVEIRGGMFRLKGQVEEKNAGYRRKTVTLTWSTIVVPILKQRNKRK